MEFGTDMGSMVGREGPSSGSAIEDKFSALSFTTSGFSPKTARSWYKVEATIEFEGGVSSMVDLEGGLSGSVDTLACCCLVLQQPLDRVHVESLSKQPTSIK